MLSHVLSSRRSGRATTQKAAIDPIGYPVARGAHSGRRSGGIPTRRASDRTAATKASRLSSTPTLNANSASGISPCGRTNLGQRAGEAQPVQKAEDESHQPWIQSRHGAASVTAHQLGGEEYDT